MYYNGWIPRTVQVSPTTSEFDHARGNPVHHIPATEKDSMKSWKTTGTIIFSNWKPPQQAVHITPIPYALWQGKRSCSWQRFRNIHEKSPTASKFLNTRNLCVCEHGNSTIILFRFIYSLHFARRSLIMTSVSSYKRIMKSNTPPHSHSSSFSPPNPYYVGILITFIT